ncbi:hypothetical protein Tco_0858302 [Tanacetum coccineum]|uniref:Tf2-1-like SH3-like domain-containing protein n=1 Tax=Tanacetum coccineum TaxID=301880 RepID=A0ABQ5B8W5_9ASTR
MLLTNATLVNPKGITVNQCTSGFHGLNEAGCKPYLGRFVIVFIDDILAYSKSKCMRNMIVILKLLLESLQEGEVVSLSPNEEVQARELTRRRLHGLEQQMERKGVGRIQVSLYLWIEFGSIGRSVWLRPMHQAWVLEWKMRIESHGILSLKFPRSSADGQRERMIQTLKDINEGMSPVLWAEIRESSLIGPELVSPWKGVVRFGKKGKLAPRYVGPFEILERIGLVAYRLRLPEELNSVHDTFHV